MDFIIVRYNMNNTKRRYNKKCKRKYITFYQKDEQLLQIANTLNFQKFIKDKLKEVGKNGTLQG